VYITDRGPGLDRKQVADAFGPPGDAADDRLAQSLNLAHALVAVHGGILWAEPLPAGGNRVSFTIPEQPPVLSGVELKGAMHALALLERFEASPEPGTTEEPQAQQADEEAPTLEEAFDLAAAVADVAALAQEPAPEPVQPEIEPEPEVVAEPEFEAIEPTEPEEPAEPAATLEELFELDPIAAELQEVAVEPELEVEEELLVFVEPESEVISPEPEAGPADDILASALAEPELEPVPEPEIAEPEPVSVPEVEPVQEPPADTDVPVEQVSEPVPVVPEPVAAAASTEVSKQSAQARILPEKFVADPLHPATALLRSLAEDYDDKRGGKPGF
jgi:hypothetical protein